MTTTVTWTPYGGDTAFQLAPAVTVNNGAGNVRRDLVDMGQKIAFGNAEWVPFLDLKSLFSGSLYRGGVFGLRDAIVLPILSRCGTEALLQAEKRVIQGLFSPELGLGTLEVTTPNGTSIAECFATGFPAFRHSPEDGDEAFGPLSSGHLMSVVVLAAPDPWFYTPLITKVTDGLADEDEFTLNNPSPVICGVYAEFTPPGGSSTDEHLAINNNTTGRSFTIADLDIPAAGKLIVDWYGTHDEALRVYILDGSTETDVMGKVGVSSEIRVVPGLNEMELLCGEVGDWTVLMQIRERYLTP